MKNNGISYADRKRLSLKIERNNSLNAQSNRLFKKDPDNYNKMNNKIKTKRLNSYKEPPNSMNQEKEKDKDKEKVKDNIKLFKKVNINNESLRNKTLKQPKNSIPTLKYIDINLNNINNINNFNNINNISVIPQISVTNRKAKKYN